MTGISTLYLTFTGNKRLVFGWRMRSLKSLKYARDSTGMFREALENISYGILLNGVPIT